MEAITDFIYHPDHQVLVCRRCQTCIGPTAANWARHLRPPPHRLLGAQLQAALAVFATYDLRPFDELRRQKPTDKAAPCRPLRGLEAFAGYYCTHPSCGFCTRRLAKMHDHMRAHGATAGQSTARRPLWQPCWLQSYFTAAARLDYFVVTGPGPGPEPEPGPGPGPGPEQPTGAGAGQAAAAAAAAAAEAAEDDDPAEPTAVAALFAALQQDLATARADAAKRAGIVQDAQGSRSARVPWLERTSFPHHL